VLGLVLVSVIILLRLVGAVEEEFDFEKVFEKTMAVEEELVLLTVLVVALVNLVEVFCPFYF